MTSARPGDLCIIFNERPRQRRHVVGFLQLEQQRRVRTEPDGFQQFVDESRIVLRQKSDGVAGLISERGRVECEFGVPRLARRARAIQIHQRRDLCFERALVGKLRLVIIELNRCAAEIDMHDGAASRRCFRRGQLGERAFGPFGRLLGIIEIEVDAIGSARGTQLFEPRVDRLTDPAEIGIGRVAECQDRETHAVEARRLIAHQRLIEIDGAGWRVALAPRCGVDDKVFRLGEERHVGVRHIEDFGVETVLLSDFLRLVGERFGVAAFAGIKDRQRCPRFRRQEPPEARRRPGPPRSPRRNLPARSAAAELS